MFDVLRALKKQDVIIIYIPQAARDPGDFDTVTVLRDGLLIGKEDLTSLTNAGILRMMFGEMEHKVRPVEYGRAKRWCCR